MCEACERIMAEISPRIIQVCEEMKEEVYDLFTILRDKMGEEWMGAGHVNEDGEAEPIELTGDDKIKVDHMMAYATMAYMAGWYANYPNHEENAKPMCHHMFMHGLQDGHAYNHIKSQPKH